MTAKADEIYTLNQVKQLLLQAERIGQEDGAGLAEKSHQSILNARRIIAVEPEVSLELMEALYLEVQGSVLSLRTLAVSPGISTDWTREMHRVLSEALNMVHQMRRVFLIA